MSIKLPEPIDSYLRHTASGNQQEAAAVFSPNATVVDQGEDTEVVGREAIHRWLIEVAAQYTTTVEVTDLVEKYDEVVLTTLVSGNFPGSPAEFVYRFTLRDGLIERLVIEFVGFK